MQSFRENVYELDRTSDKRDSELNHFLLIYMRQLGA